MHAQEFVVMTFVSSYLTERVLLMCEPASHASHNASHASHASQGVSHASHASQGASHASHNMKN